MWRKKIKNEKRKKGKEIGKERVKSKENKNWKQKNALLNVEKD